MGSNGIIYDYIIHKALLAVKCMQQTSLLP